MVRWMISLLLLASLSLTLSDDVTRQMFGDVTEGLPAAFGDFNSDKLMDIFMLRNKARTMEILFGQDKEPNMRTKGLKCTFDLRVTSVVPGDFNGDALMDVMVTVLDSPAGIINQVIMLWGEMNTINCTNKYLFKTTGQPLVIDYNKDMVMDLFGVDVNSQRSFWVFNETRQFSKIEMREFGNSTNTIRIPHSHAFLELTDDNTADLYVTTEKNFEIWKGNKDSGFSPWRLIPFPDGVREHGMGQTVFLDVELEGKLDHLVPVCFNTSCRDSRIFVYSNDSWHDLQVDFKEPGTDDLWQFPMGLSDLYLNPTTLRAGDFNMDGYPDLLATLVSAKDSLYMKSFFFENVPCKTSCIEFSRTYEIQWNLLSDYNNNTVLGVFFDFLQNGVLDIIFVKKKESMYDVSVYRNKENYDAYFIKVIVVIGLTNPKQQPIVGPLRKSESVYGTNLPGPKICYRTTSQDGSPRAAVAPQIPQSAHFSLNLPYIVFGLGRTPNFIDRLTVKVYGKHPSWSELIPNSQIVVKPYPIDDSNNYWKAQLFLTPSKLIVQSVIVLSATCIVILITIGLLHWKERREDNLKKLEESHKFHFDAM